MQFRLGKKLTYKTVHIIFNKWKRTKLNNKQMWSTHCKAFTK